MMTILQFQHPYLTKKQLGILLITMALTAAVGLMAVNVLRHHLDIGPAQRLVLAGSVAMAVLGTTLIPLGSRRVVGDIELAKPAHSTGPAAWLATCVVFVGLVIMLLHFVVYVNYSLSLASFPFDYDQGEGFELNDTVLLSQGQWPYRDNNIYPFYASNYPPLYHVVLVPFVWLFGPQYWYGRLAGFLATLIAAAAIAYAVHRTTRHRAAAALSGLAFLASNYVYHIGPLFRQHISMVMLETVAIVVLGRLSDQPQASRIRGATLFAGLFLLLAAGFTKQLAVTTVGAAFLYLFLRWPRRTLLWGVSFAAIAGLLFLGLNLATGGQWWLNIITANVNQYILSQFSGLFRQFISLHGALLILAVLLIVYELYVERLSLYTFWFLASATTGVLAGKWGAGDSYFATMIAATCVLAGIFIGRCLNRTWCIPADVGPRMGKLIAGIFSPALGIAAGLLFILYGLAVIHLPLDHPVFGPIARVLNLQSNTKFANFYDSAGWTMGYATIGQVPTATDVANGWKIVTTAGGDDRPILSEEAAFSFRLGKPVVTNPTQLLNLYQNGHYDPTALGKMIEDQAFGAVIFRARFYPQPVLDAVDRAYKPEQTISMNGYDYTVLKPDPAWPAHRSMP